MLAFRCGSVPEIVEDGLIQARQFGKAAHTGRIQPFGPLFKIFAREDLENEMAGVQVTGIYAAHGDGFGARKRDDRV